ncbi:type VI secretion system baseplate subunit TssK [Pseudomonas indica]|uniref:type VI secretion system baseplate subunit TssK n=1 Tax=Pseudomonas indica TaxID=137658 RepID=UPI000BABCA34|nr:type VI secretion system baseplate subunit TssK [Pseudomonas indica]PAU59179.1 type VI secretion system-associated protein [Pseudomonas indica]
MSALPDVVCWHEGMQLLPQHFQLQGLRAEALAAHFAKACNPWFWGVEQFEIDPSALCAGKVRVTAVDAILPDGLPVRLNLASDGALELDVADAIAASGHPSVTVYLSVSPLWRGGQLLPLNGRLTSAVGDAVPDLASGEHPEPIVVWRPNARLTTDANKADSICLPLLKVGKQGGGYVQLSYVPPTPRILPESPLGQQVAALCGRAREKCLFLAGRLRNAQQAGNRDDADEIRRQLAALWARLPEVEAALNSRVATPASLHALLAGMAGSWSALDPIAGVPAFAPLDFLELQRGYTEVLNWLGGTLERVRAGYRSIPFEQDGQGFHLQLPDRDQPRQRLVIGLRMPAGASDHVAAEWLGRAIIASEAHIATLARQRMSGLPQQAMSRQEQVAYSVGEDTRLFVVQAAGEWFDPQQKLRIVQPGSSGGIGPWQVVLFMAADDTV